MKKKIKPRELRKAQNAQRKEKRAIKIEQAKAPVVIAVSSEAISTSAKKMKSSAKAAGLKSTLVAEDKLYMTSFGKGNEAVIEQKVDTADYSVSDMKSEPSIIVQKADKKEVSFSSSRPFVNKSCLSAVNPLYGGNDSPKKAVGQDMLGLKNKLEDRYFGKSFNDNIHIQLIHNILDIEKIIAVYATNITAAIDHMVDGDDEEYINSDFIGYMNTLNRYEVFMVPSKNPTLSDRDKDNIDKSREKFEHLLETKRLGYFGFEYDKNSKDNLKQEEIKKRLYHLIAFAGQLRQWSFHSAGEYPRSWLYQLGNAPLDNEYRATLDYFFDQRFNEINEHFAEQNHVNLHILKEVFPNDDFRKIAELYYDFIVIKSYKNIGFSIKKLREKMLVCSEATKITGTEMDDKRSKLYKLIDFCLYYFYYNNNERCNNNVDRLRSAEKEEQKETFYTEEAKMLWEKYGDTFLYFCDKLGVWVQGDYKAEVSKYIDVEAYRKNSEVSYFSKLLYAMSFFLDGKEINDLLTTLINKFDNIASFIETAKELGVDVEFVKNYDFFNNSRDYVGELNIIKNIARMKKPTEKAKNAMYRDALKILGVPTDMKDEEFNAEIEKMLEKKIDPATGNPARGKNPFRNFIANNVIENSRFIYVIKFCNPENVRRLVNNTEVTKFVLKRMPEAQIDRYFKSCIGGELNPTTEKKIEELSNRIMKMDFSNFRNVRQKVREKSPEAAEKERFKAIISLYLTVVYLLVKNLVNVNARYIMAFHCLERDAKLYGVQNISSNYLALTAKLCAEGDDYCKKLSEAKQNNTQDKVQMPKNYFLARNKRLRECIKVNLNNANSMTYTFEKWNNKTKSKDVCEMATVSVYRNNVAHLTAVRNCAEFIDNITKIDSYFALYHYLIQRQIMKSDLTANYYPDKVNKYYGSLNEWKTYVKDMVKALNAPFGYNIPRFKNLSIDALFDRNETKEVSDDDKCQELDK